MIDLSNDRYVAAKHVLMLEAQREYQQRLADFNRELWLAFRNAWPGRAGKTISVRLTTGRWITGRAVILQNGTKIGLYVDDGHRRTAVPEPYTLNATQLRT